jgi:hypothetical protein
VTFGEEEVDECNEEAEEEDGEGCEGGCGYTKVFLMKKRE